MSVKKKITLREKKERFQSAMTIAPILALVSAGFIGMIMGSEIDSTVVGISFIISFGVFYLAGYYLPIRRWFN